MLNTFVLTKPSTAVAPRLQTVTKYTLSPHLPKVYKQIGRNSRDEMDEINHSESKLMRQN